ncbi:MAG: protein translocase subunit SecD [Pseudanabaenaceae cyanobacterium]
MVKPSSILIGILIGLGLAIYWAIAHPVKLGLDLQGGAQLTLQALPNPEQGITEITPKVMESAQFIVKQRIDGLGVAEAVVLVVGNDQLSVQLPGVTDPAQAERVIGKTAQLEFRPQKQGTEAELRARQIEAFELSQRLRLLQLAGDKSDPKLIAETEAQLRQSRLALKNLFDSVGLTGSMLRDAVASPSPDGNSWDVSLSFNEEGGKLFAKITAEVAGTGRSLGIFLDDEPISLPVVDVKFQGTGITGGQARIEGRFSLEAANELALQLRAGALPVPIKLVENRTVGATLGADSVQSSVYAGVAGLVLVLIYMVVYYRLLGVVADFALLAYAVFTYALFSLLGVVLTLPGIAGFILSIGMAVDANVLIFERTREELLAGRSLYKSVEAGFNRAWSSILDSNVTTLIACGALFWLGSGFVKGFAVTLAVGVLTSMFTAITLSRSLLLTLISNPNLKKPHLYGVKSIGKPVTS